MRDDEKLTRPASAIGANTESHSDFEIVCSTSARTGQNWQIVYIYLKLQRTSWRVNMNDNRHGRVVKTAS